MPCIGDWREEPFDIARGCLVADEFWLGAALFEIVPTLFTEYRVRPLTDHAIKTPSTIKCSMFIQTEAERRRREAGVKQSMEI